MSEKIPVHISKELYEKIRKFVEEQGGFSMLRSSC